MTDVLLKFSHGLGDAVQLTCVLRHLAKHRPDWTIDVASKVGKHSTFHGQCRRSWILDRESIPEHKYHVVDLGWYECYSVFADSPCTKVCNCLRDVFGIVPECSLLKYRIEVGDQARDIACRYLSQICDGRAPVAELAPVRKTHSAPNSGAFGSAQKSTLERPFPVVAIHYEGNTSAHKKNLAHRQIAPLCRELLHRGYTPLILDWDRRSPLPDQKTIFCPGVGPASIGAARHPRPSASCCERERAAAAINPILAGRFQQLPPSGFTPTGDSDDK